MTQNRCRRRLATLTSERWIQKNSMRACFERAHISRLLANKYVTKSRDLTSDLQVPWFPSPVGPSDPIGNRTECEVIGRSKPCEWTFCALQDVLLSEKMSQIVKRLHWWPIEALECVLWFILGIT